MEKRLQIAKADIFEAFDQAETRLYRQRDIEVILNQGRQGWRLSTNTNTGHFIDFLIRREKLKAYEFPSPNGPTMVYSWGSVSLIEAALFLNLRSYLSHYTAMRVHGLTEQLPKTLYVTYEPASPLKPKAQGELSQKAIDIAFSKPQRTSSSVAEVGTRRVQFISGKPCGQVGVEDGEVTDEETGEKVPARITGVERTLIDITVRPLYAGGATEVLKAFENAREMASANRLMALLKKLGHVYPYHQAIGFYMERAGFKGTAIDLLRRIPRSFQFYLMHDMKETVFDSSWNLHVPKSL